MVGGGSSCAAAAGLRTFEPGGCWHQYRGREREGAHTPSPLSLASPLSRWTRRSPESVVVHCLSPRSPTFDLLVAAGCRRLGACLGVRTLLPHPHTLSLSLPSPGTSISHWVTHRERAVGRVCRRRALGCLLSPPSSADRADSFHHRRRRRCSSSNGTASRGGPAADSEQPQPPLPSSCIA